MHRIIDTAASVKAVISLFELTDTQPCFVWIPPGEKSHYSLLGYGTFVPTARFFRRARQDIFLRFIFVFSVC